MEDPPPPTNPSFFKASIEITPSFQKANCGQISDILDIDCRLNPSYVEETLSTPTTLFFPSLSIPTHYSESLHTHNILFIDGSSSGLGKLT